jgi:hypothetical protein
MSHWKAFEYNGVIYDLTHLHPNSLIFCQEAKDDKPLLEYKVDVTFSMHCFTRGIKPNEKPDENMLYVDHRESRVFDLRRYDLSKGLPAIVKELHRRKCQHSGKGNFFVVDVITQEGERLNYEIYFKASRSSKKGVINLYVQSAYIRDAAHRSNTPNKKSIGFTIILFNILNNKPIKIPK